MKWSFLIALGFLSSSAFASELSQIIQCHEAIKNFGDGNTMNLTNDKPTPIVLRSGGKLYFITSDTISTIDNKFADQTVVFKLQENHQDLYRKISFNKDGSFGMISFEEIKNDPKAKEPHAALDKNSLDAIKADLALRLKTLSDEYPNTVNIPKRLATLNQCNEVQSAEVQKNLAEQKARFEKRQGKKSTGSSKSGAK